MVCLPAHATVDICILTTSILQVSFTFSGNKALIASAVFMRDLDLCSWTQFENPHFDPARVLRWEFVHLK